MRVSNVKQVRLASFKLEYLDDEALITYDRSKLTPRWFDEMLELPLRRMLPEVIVSWDLVNDDGTPFVPESTRIGEILSDLEATFDADPNAEPPTIQNAAVIAWRELLATFPQDFLDAVLAAMLEDLSGGKVRSAASGASSQQEATTAISPGSTRQSEHPVFSEA